MSQMVFLPNVPARSIENNIKYVYLKLGTKLHPD